MPSPRPARASKPRGRVLRASIPATRDPFINALMKPLTPDPHSGAERFWISTWNGRNGSLGVVVDEHGAGRIHRFGDAALPGFYSAAPAGPQDPDGLWLCGLLDKAVRLDLRSGKSTIHATGAPGALVFSGMPLDLATGKLLAMAFVSPRTVAMSFDIRSRKPVKVWDIPSQAHYMRFSFPNGDGTWTIVAHLPGDHLLLWDPRTDLIEEVHRQHDQPHKRGAGTTYQLARDESGRAYLPDQGWYDARTRSVSADGPRPDEEMTWFGRVGRSIVGCNLFGSDTTLGVWDMDTGAVRTIGSIPDCTTQNVALTSSGKIVAVNVYGEFFRLDAMSGAIECSRRLDASAVGSVDCLCRLDQDRVLGTPFITQRFWEVNLKSKRGFDAGRAAPGFGEIMRLIKLRGKVYMGAYGGGELMEYDPAQPPRYPENPRLVADPPGGMRPVAICTDGRNVFYSSSRDYGHLGSIVTRYDTRTGQTSYGYDPLPDQMIHSLVYDKSRRRLLGGTMYVADCESCPPTSDRCYFTVLDPVTLQATDRWAAPKGNILAAVCGPLRGGQWLCRCSPVFDGGDRSTWFAWDMNTPPPDPLPRMELPPQTRGVYPAGTPGLFVVSTGTSLHLWNAAKPAATGELYRGKAWLHHVVVQDDSILAATDKEVVVIEGWN